MGECSSQAPRDCPKSWNGANTERPAHRTLDFANKQEEDDTACDTSKPSNGAKEKEAPINNPHGPCNGVDHRFDAFRSNYGPYQTTTNSLDRILATGPINHISLILNSPRATPWPSVRNPYSTGRTPLTNRDLCQANDFYLGVWFGQDDGDELDVLCDVLNLPQNWFSTHSTPSFELLRKRILLTSTTNKSRISLAWQIWNWRLWWIGTRTWRAN